MAPSHIKNCSCVEAIEKQRADERRTQDMLEDDEVRESLKRLRDAEEAHHNRQLKANAKPVDQGG